MKDGILCIGINWTINKKHYICIYIYVYGEKNIVLVFVPRVDSDERHRSARKLCVLTCVNKS